MTATGRPLTWIGLAALLSCLVLLGGVAAGQGSQPDPTLQQQTQDAVIQGYFQGTATAQMAQAATATLEAAFSAAQTATAQAALAQTATLAAAFSAAQTATRMAVNPNFIVDDLEVVSVRDLPLLAGPGRTSAYLAPNGEIFAHLDGDEICIYTITGVQQRCISLDYGDGFYSVPTERITWSPDSRYLALESEDFLRMFRDADILVIDTETGRLTNLTDDGANCTRLLRQDENCTALHDFAPTWLPDSTDLVFNRFDVAGEKRVSYLYQVGVEGGEPQRLGLLPVQLFAYALAVSADGQKLAFNFDAGDDRRDGLWISDLDGRNAQQIFNVQSRIEVPFQITFSADGHYLLTADSRLGAFGPTADPGDSAIRVSAVDGSLRQSVLDTGALVRGAGWSPYGAALAYIVYDPNERDQAEPTVSGLYLTNAPGEPGRRVLPGLFVPTTSLNTQPIGWGANNVLLLTAPGQPRLFVVQLGEK